MDTRRGRLAGALIVPSALATVSRGDAGELDTKFRGQELTLTIGYQIF
jgi:hypothetical protein